MPNTIKTNSSFPQITLSNRLYDKAERLIPSGTQTLAKGPGQYTKGIAPKFIHKGKVLYHLAIVMKKLIMQLLNS